MRYLARDYYLENREMNRAKGAAEKARKALFKVMMEAGLDGFDFATEDAEGQKLPLVVSVGATERKYWDVEKLRELVEEEQLFQIVTATKAAIEKVAGKDVAVLCERSAPGETNVSVKAAA